MKKIFTILGVAAMVVAVSAQGSETFTSQTTLTSSYANGTFTGETAGVTVNFQHSRDEGLGTSDDYSINGKGIMLRRVDEQSFVEFVIPNGVGQFSFNYRKAFTGGTNNRVLAVFVNGVEGPATANFGAAGADPTVHTLVTSVNQAGPVTIRISYPTGTSTGNKQVTIDDVQWSANGSTLSVTDITAVKSNFVKNTQVTDFIHFGSKADVKIYNMNGQVVKTANVSDRAALDASDLTPGMYIVTGTVEGKAVSQKILKK
ncbi:T9SS type A sorting domain-containing protein [Chryseobacterium sp. MFBS3-17]|uniref:T9SS type A sorting domain-containing protein n=1 Tax=Chryseobacterium sp. MFBS3-17 TaxID=2886689 RepID=UPI001D0EB1AB|nr:T9SS type A sorting domain-containing protein [Chryseobacterium sp. MFBS3-17]MCC2591121.1 T9SS type A sorting domain-containing protein [Chryseobacterium sp. MFBS3-17]